MQYIKAKTYKKEPLEGSWIASIKLDGVRTLITDEGVFSRNGKKLPGLKYYFDQGIRGDFEFFAGSFDKSISIARTDAYQELPREYLYSLDPLDGRLSLNQYMYPTPETVAKLLDRVVEAGHEGLVLRSGQEWYKVKKEDTYDVPITDVLEGTNKNTGKLGALETSMGKVGTGFTDALRQELWNKRSEIIGKMIEVRCMELTSDGKFRHPSFVRFREDKDEE